MHPLNTILRAHPIKQVALVVRDLEAAMRQWSDFLGVGPFNAFTLTPAILRDMHYQGQPAEFSFRHALGWKGEMQIELVQPISGPSIFADHLAAHGEGLHHLGVYVPDQPAAVAELIDMGLKPLQGARGFGLDGDGAFTYFDPPPGISAIVELIGAPSRRRPPEITYPVTGS